MPGHCTIGWRHGDGLLTRPRRSSGPHRECHRVYQVARATRSLLAIDTQFCAAGRLCGHHSLLGGTPTPTHTTVNLPPLESSPISPEEMIPAPVPSLCEYPAGILNDGALGGPAAPLRGRGVTTGEASRADGCQVVMVMLPSVRGLGCSGVR